MKQTSCEVTIFEGPDGAGKTTVATKYAEMIGARYIHFPAMLDVNKNLARMYVEAMLPAILGYQDVVLDRCWPSETIYSHVHRNGNSRITRSHVRMLDRLSMRCGAVVVKCLPPWETVRKNYLSRKDMEMLDNENQLKSVYDLYEIMTTGIQQINYDYTQGDVFDDSGLYDSIQYLRTKPHLINFVSAGNWDAKTILIGNSMDPIYDEDSFYRWPFASFRNIGYSKWLTSELDYAGIPEADILWVDDDQDISEISDLTPDRIISIGRKAYHQLYRMKISTDIIEHPYIWKSRIGLNEDCYPIVNLIKGEAR